jgi:putative tryptophan/tyrosine transport system substrate-binding protein
MRRREFISLLGGAAAWVSPARAQERRRVIGVLYSMGLPRLAEVILPAFSQGLKDAGFVEERNISPHSPDDALISATGTAIQI